MKKSIALAAVAAAVFSASGVLAQSADMYVTKGDGDKWTFHGGTAGSAGTEVLSAEAGAKPSNCAEGSYWLNDDQMLVSCADDKEFGFAEITEGQKMAAGEDFPENSFIVQENGKPMSDFSTN